MTVVVCSVYLRALYTRARKARKLSVATLIQMLKRKKRMLTLSHSFRAWRHLVRWVVAAAGPSLSQMQ